MTKLLMTLALAASVTACSWNTDMYDNNVHHDMKKHDKYIEYGHEKYDYPPYRQQCPANHRAKGWC